ncbi:hypothetical protein HPB51_019417 [Rhipicephalus microplus]|uniref:Uncharacterized protein n=1 Tax=Rhipicephalus microplus TaxID=6941 RepID=A0A9J6EQ61_RHIMP|nr:hypothetical protein HPB51_019417 [Rhipicephalus microplus]
MSQIIEKKRRKLYLGPDTEFLVPRSTRWYSQQSTSSASATATTRLAGVLNSPPDSSHASQASPGDRCLTGGCSVDTSSIGVRTEVLEGSDDSFNSAQGVGGNAYQSPEECPDNESNHSENDSEDRDTRPFRDTDQDPSSGTEEDSGDYLCEDGASVDRDQNPGAEGDISGDRSSVPSFEESDLLARCVADFGTKTLPGSATTIAVAIVLIMSFIAAHGLSWSAVDDLLKLLEALFGREKCGLPQLKYLLRKLWAPIYLNADADGERTSAGIRRDMTLASRLKTRDCLSQVSSKWCASVGDEKLRSAMSKDDVLNNELGRIFLSVSIGDLRLYGFPGLLID